MDNYAIKSGQQVLAVSYPKEFISDTNIAETLTKGEIMQVTTRNPINNYWYTKGLTTNGQSGSPVVVVGDKSEPAVIGMLIASSEYLNLNSADGIHLEKKSDGVFQTLSIENLISRIDR
jgi:hypothetical protein